MSKLFSIVILLSINSLGAMEVVDASKKVPGSRTGEFSYEAMEKTVGPSYDLVGQSYSIPHYEPADRDKRFNKGRHPDYQDNTLHEAVAQNDIAKVSELLRSGKYSANALNGYGTTPLFFVRSLAMASLLLEHKADVNAVSQCGGDFPLHAIVQSPNAESKEIIELILAKGANVNALSWRYTTPLTMAQYGRADVIALLKSKGAEDSFMTLDVIRKAEALKKN